MKETVMVSAFGIICKALLPFNFLYNYLKEPVPGT